MCVVDSGLGVCGMEMKYFEEAGNRLDEYM